MKAVILVGGKGTRMRPLTCSIPKVVVPVLNRPLLEHTLRSLGRQGIGDIVLAVGYLPEVVQERIGDGSQLGIRITYVIEQEPLGTSGAVKNAQKYLDEPFFVFNGDMLTGIDLTAMMEAHRKVKPKVTMALIPVDNPTIYGVVETNKPGMITRFVEKPTWDQVTTNMINAGIYIVEPEVLRLIPAGVFSMFEHNVFPKLLEMGEPLLAYPSDAYWIDVGAPDKYLKANLDLLRQRPREIQREGVSEIHPEARIEPPVLIGDGCFISARAHIVGPVVLGQGCRVLEDAGLEGSVLWDGVDVWNNTVMKGCVIASQTVVEEDCRLEECVTGHHVVIGREVEEFGARIPPHSYVAPRGAKTPPPPPSSCPT
ncbi:MAG: NDP-sugar synthase [Chloroflexi bacterium]|nr:NDP-sugar synthase [Chloroflexota bacterium]